MPSVTRWFIKAGILYFIAGAVLALIAEIPSINTGPLLLPVYWHMLVLGWITQVIMGVSLWMFPRKYRDKMHRESLLTWLTFWMLNTGLVLRFLSEPFLPVVHDRAAIVIMVVISSIFQVAAIITYMLEIWPRLQSKKQKKQGRL